MAGALVEAAKNDPFIRVQRGALLSLGRVLAKSRVDPVALELAALDRGELIAMLNDKLDADDEVVRSYAAYCLGELGPELPDYVLDRLIAYLDPKGSFALRCNALLALVKISPEEVAGSERLSRVEVLMRANLSAAASSEHPGSAYREWFLEQGWRLLTHLSLSRLAALYARTGAETFAKFPKRSKYLEALAQCQLAEAELGQAHLQRAIDRLKDAAAKLEEMRRISSKPGDLSQRTVDASSIRSLLVHARLATLESLLGLRILGLELSRVEGLVEKAEALYRQVLEGRPAEPTQISVADSEGSPATAEREYELVGIHLMLTRLLHAVGRVWQELNAEQLRRSSPER